jgi:P4 family phage/plasmid primase-like protien
MIEEAQRLIELGLPIIPLCPPDHAHMSQNHISRCKCPGKIPLIKDWVYKNVTTTTELQSWQQQFRNFNIGMPLGDASGYCGIDVDGEAGIKLLMEMSKGDLPSTWEFNTSAGSRLLYKIPAGIATKKFKQSGSNTHEECALICTGQQTVMPPSIHASGIVYQWVEGHSPWDIDCAKTPEWLIKAIQIDPISVTTPTTTPFKIQEKISFADEFGPSNLSEETTDLTSEDFFGMPASTDLAQPNTIERKGKSGHKIIITDEILAQPIPEGQRDNTMTAIVGHYCANADLRRLGKPMIMQICLDHNHKFCQPPLEDQAIQDKVNYFFDLEAAKTEGFKAQKADRPIFKASEQAKNVLKYLQNQGIILEFDPFTHTHYYCTLDDGPWHWTTNTLLLNGWIRDVVKSPHFGDPSWDKRSYIEETRNALEESFVHMGQQNSKFDLGTHSAELSRYIVIAGGMLDWRTSEIKEWDPTYYTTIAFNRFDYDPEAECPYFEQYLSEWLPEETLRLVVQEYLGYCLIPDTSYRKALYLYGKGRNGKSVFLEMLQDFFGDLSSTLSYDGLFQRFGTAQLQNRIINIYDDTTISFAKDTGIAKNIIAGGKLNAERKGKDAFEFINVARLIYSAQEMPRTSDTTLAWYDRWFFVKFSRTFETSGTKKHEMQENMRQEFPGIFNWMVRGLQRLDSQGKFTYCDSLASTTLEYRGLNDNVVQFLQSFTSTMPTDIAETRISTADWYKIYEVFVDREGLHKVSRKVFKLRMNDAGYHTTIGKVGNINSTAYYPKLVLATNLEDVRDSMLEIRLATQLK